MATLRTIVAGRLKNLGVTQRELAAQAGLNPTYISEILSGKKLRVQRRFVPALAHALKIAPEILYAKASGGGTKKAAPPTTSAERTVIEASSPETEARFSNEMRTFQLDPNFDPKKHVPLFVEPLRRDYHLRLKNGDVEGYVPFVWPEFLGPSNGCYAIKADALADNNLSEHWIYLVAPGRSIKLGEIFVGEFRYEFNEARLEVHKMQDATQLSFILTDINGGNPQSVPRGVIRRFHKVVGMFELPS